MSPHSWSSGSHELQFVMLEVQVRKSQVLFVLKMRKQTTTKKSRETWTFVAVSPVVFVLPVVLPVFLLRKEKVASNLPQDQSALFRIFPLRCHLVVKKWSHGFPLPILYPIKLTYRVLLHHYQSINLSIKNKCNEIKSNQNK